MQKPVPWMLVIAGMGALGCGGPPSVEEVAEAAAGTAVALVKDGRAAQALVGGYDATMNSSGISPQIPDDLKPYLVPILPDVWTHAEVPDTAVSRMSNEYEASEVFTERLRQFLKNRIFIEENVEERKGDYIIFRITGEDVCTDGN
jgi:hypothetical protein